jgi:hypothetical protein
VAHIAVGLAIDAAAGRVAEQVRRIDEARAAAVDGVEVQRDDVALAAEGDGDVARVRRPGGVERIRRGVEDVVVVDVVERHKPAMARLRHQIGVKLIMRAVALTMDGDGEPLVRRPPARDDAVLALRIGVLGRGVRLRQAGKHDEERSSDGTAELHDGLSRPKATAFNDDFTPPA